MTSSQPSSALFCNIVFNEFTVTVVALLTTESIAMDSLEHNNVNRHVVTEEKQRDSQNTAHVIINHNHYVTSMNTLHSTPPNLQVIIKDQGDNVFAIW